MRRFVTLAVVLMCAVVLAAPLQAGDQITLSWVAGGAGGGWYSMAGGIATIIKEADPDIVKYGQEIGLEIRARARDREGMIRAVEAGCNGMTINWPDWLTEYLKNKESKQICH